MMNKNLFFTIIISFSLVFASCSHTSPENEPEVRVFSDEPSVSPPDNENTITSASDPWPPFACPDHPGQGILIEVTRAAFESQGYTLEHEFMPWSRSWINMLNGDIDIIPITWYTEERAEEVLFSDALLYNHIKVISPKGSNFNYTGLESLEGKSVGTIIGYGYSDEFLEADNFERYESSSFISNIQMLMAERLDLVVEDEVVARHSLSMQAPELVGKIEFSDIPLSVNPLSIVSSYQNPGHEEIIAAFNKGLEQIKADGTYDEIISQLNAFDNLKEDKTRNN